jgi:hypothetical protein
MTPLDVLRSAANAAVDAAEAIDRHDATVHSGQLLVAARVFRSGVDVFEAWSQIEQQRRQVAR